MHNASVLANDTCAAKPRSLQDVIFLKFVVALEEYLNSLIRCSNGKLAWIP